MIRAPGRTLQAAYLELRARMERAA